MKNQTKLRNPFETRDPNRPGRLSLLAAAVLGGALLAGPSFAASESCREWRGEHRDWKIAALASYLAGAPQTSLDAAMFEVLQREAYMTSCRVAVEVGREDLVGWRLVDRPADEFASAVPESVLEKAGLELDLRRRFERELRDHPEDDADPPSLAVADPNPYPRSQTRTRSRAGWR